ncbi:MoaD/ThiS family protein [Allosaccharopolyspora coralli]|uniref:MoaD/ThiS family protein n=1 Tax=Allosaccharopolyspora coralli TaxID=2665642 RepID=A0A5Q3Q5X0_9PSEU|nr:MoaD/ThiS family protein [Allosaccharopolyspora coralli]QGK68564.1 MoaD/ThiS family protein [Allosaccharopolyspora coralli]
MHVRYFAGARAAAGVAEETVRLEADGRPHDAATVIGALHDRHESLASVLPACSFLLAGLAVRDRSVAVPDGATLDVLPPFAGG